MTERTFVVVAVVVTEQEYAELKSLAVRTPEGTIRAAIRTTIWGANRDAPYGYATATKAGEASTMLASEYEARQKPPGARQ